MNKISRKGFLKIAAAAAMLRDRRRSVRLQCRLRFASTSGSAGLYTPGTYEEPKAKCSGIGVVDSETVTRMP